MNLPQLMRAIETVKALREPEGGCPWDLAQNHQTLIPFLIEESYEYIYAIEQQDPEGMKEELGDILLQVLLHARIAEQEGRFTLEEVSQTLVDKLVFRHPHVFKDKTLAKTAEEGLQNWKQMKEVEKQSKGQSDEEWLPSTLLRFPSLFSSYKIGKKSKDLHFDWDSEQEVWEKVEEEWNELNHEWEKIREQKIEAKKEPHHPVVEKLREELGDLLFTLSQFARHLKMNPEEVLREANYKFYHRFKLMQDQLVADGKDDMLTLTAEEKLTYWEKAKKDAHNGPKMD